MSLYLLRSYRFYCLYVPACTRLIVNPNLRTSALRPNILVNIIRIATVRFKF
nr:MAG TPA: hypothetical protein [Caudoviricetes sp.]